jgi:hypothetical protein
MSSRCSSRGKILSAELKAEVERRLGADHAARIAQLTQQLSSTLAPHLTGAPSKGAADTDRRFPPGALAAHMDGRPPPGASPAQQEPKLAALFDELLVMDEHRRLGALADEVAQQQRLQDQLDDARVEVCQAHAAREAAAHQASRAVGRAWRQGVRH